MVKFPDSFSINGQNFELTKRQTSIGFIQKKLTNLKLSEQTISKISANKAKI